MTIRRYKEFLLNRLNTLIHDSNYRIDDIVATYKLYYSICKVSNDETLILVDICNNITKIFDGYIL